MPHLLYYRARWAIKVIIWPFRATREIWPIICLLREAPLVYFCKCVNIVTLL